MAFDAEVNEINKKNILSTYFVYIILNMQHISIFFNENKSSIINLLDLNVFLFVPSIGLLFFN